MVARCPEKIPVKISKNPPHHKQAYIGKQRRMRMQKGSAQDVVKATEKGRLSPKWKRGRENRRTERGGEGVFRTPGEGDNIQDIEWKKRRDEAFQEGGGIERIRGGEVARKGLTSKGGIERVFMPLRQKKKSGLPLNVKFGGRSARKGRFEMSSSGKGDEAVSVS